MNAVLDRIRAKITRAKQHIQDFDLRYKSFVDTNPYTVTYKEDPQAGKRIYYLLEVKPVPAMLETIAADVIQNLRSPLDHIASQLVLAAHGGAEPDWQVYFPISGSAADYPATRRGKIKGVRQEVIDAIDATEPYPDGKGRALWQLNELNKPDKHKSLLAIGAYSYAIDMTGRAALDFKVAFGKDVVFPSFGIMPARRVTVLQVGDPLYAEPLELQVEKNKKFGFAVTFDKPGIIEHEPAQKTMLDMANLVDDIVCRLGRLLP